MRLLVAGASGQVGRELVRLAPALGFEIAALTRADLDITDRDAVARAVADHAPDAAINAAAWTAVDAAEDREGDAHRVNEDGARNLAKACAAAGIPLLHYSTDYVFDGRTATEYAETDRTAPINAYGRSKLAGEHAVRETCDRHVILRTSWVFSKFGRNFVKTILQIAHEQPELRIVADQTGKPTSAAWLASTSLQLLSRKGIAWGLYHAAQAPAVSWHSFAIAIVEAARRHGAKLVVEQLLPVTSDDFSTRAERPRNSVLKCDALEKTFGVTVDDWHEDLDTTVGELLNDVQS